MNQIKQNQKVSSEKRNRVYGRWYIPEAKTPLERANNKWIAVSIQAGTTYDQKFAAYDAMKKIANVADCRVDPFPFTREGLEADRRYLEALSVALRAKMAVARG